MVIVLPWHDPIRVAEGIATLDNMLSGRRLSIGFGRGLGRREFGALRVPMEESRERFIEGARHRADGAEQRVVRATTASSRRFPARHCGRSRVRPAAQLIENMYCAWGSPQTIPIAAQTGLKALFIPQTTWDDYAHADGEVPRPPRRGGIRAGAPDRSRCGSTARRTSKKRPRARGSTSRSTPTARAATTRSRARTSRRPRATSTTRPAARRFARPATGQHGRDVSQQPGVGHARAVHREDRPHQRADGARSLRVHHALRQHADRRRPKRACGCSPARCCPVVQQMTTGRGRHRSGVAVTLADLLIEHPFGDDRRAAVHDRRRGHRRARAVGGARRPPIGWPTPGVVPGQAVAVQLPNGPEIVTTMIGVWLAGAVFVPINARAPAARSRVGRSSPHGRAPSLRADGIEMLADAATFAPDAAFATFTSGTTGRPEGDPAHPHRVPRIARPHPRPAAGRSRRTAAAKPPSPNLIPVSLTLNAGIYNVLFGLRAGSAIVIMDRFVDRPTSRRWSPATRSARRCCRRRR